jgi:hypothetical protein
LSGSSWIIPTPGKKPADIVHTLWLASDVISVSLDVFDDSWIPVMSMRCKYVNADGDRAAWGRRMCLQASRPVFITVIWILR